MRCFRESLRLHHLREMRTVKRIPRRAPKSPASARKLSRSAKGAVRASERNLRVKELALTQLFVQIPQDLRAIFP